MMDNETINIYNAQANKYADLTQSDAEDQILADFIQALPKGAVVLDLGCGPGHWAARMQSAGLAVIATDASEEMVALARQHPGVDARLATFDELPSDVKFDGVWANFSLLHAPRADFPRHLAALKAVLNPGGLLHIGLKTGDGEHRDKLGRRYTYYQPDDLDKHLRTAGFTPFHHQTGAGTGLDGQIANWIVVRAHA
ncbi:class I SAM-dependent DNA methyltransferase [Cochlodiniinecator piscidefendens]|uniref:class I SAM-dependent DNA methyltransferase n=1 Tax=Cochlodiniinecator piscidefendens TaxID=2715756 RepID=UPI00140DEB55|nr:class I SAM-dependent methyltransferase [Cochlodiniinecator piscidefendens]